MEIVNKPATDDPVARDASQSAQRDLTRAALEAIGYSNRAAKQIVRAPYVATAFAQAVKRHDEALAALPQIAQSTGRIAELNEQAAKMLSAAMAAEQKAETGTAELEPTPATKRRSGSK
jgi:hypothetical protein